MTKPWEREMRKTHTHCWCQRVFVPSLPAAGAGAGVVAHDQCCVCGDRRVAEKAGMSKEVQ